MRSKFIFAIIASILMRPCEGKAQSEGYVEARIRFISMTRPLGGVGVISNRKAHGVVIPTDMFADEVAYRGPARLELVQMSASLSVPENGPKDSEMESVEPALRSRIRGTLQTITYRPTGGPPVAWIDLPQKQGLLHLIILVTPGKGNGMVMLSDKPGSFPPGSNRYLNLCSFPLTIKTPSGDYVVQPGNSQILRPGALDMTYYDLQVLKRDSTVVFSSRIYHAESTRKLYLLSEIGATERVQLKAIIDRPSPPKFEADAGAGKK